MASTGSVDGWPLGPTELGEAGLRVLLRLPTQASSSYTELKSSCARHDVRIRISSNYYFCTTMHGFDRINTRVLQLDTQSAYILHKYRGEPDRVSITYIVPASMIWLAALCVTYYI